jgi:hypothetical protein
MYSTVPANAVRAPKSQNRRVTPILCVACITVHGVRNIPVPNVIDVSFVIQFYLGT